jgi:hypothetical protein
MSSLSTGEYDGWENYPQNLGLPATIDVDPSWRNDQINRLSTELFVANHESKLGCLNLGESKQGMHIQEWDAVSING